MNSTAINCGWVKVEAIFTVTTVAPKAMTPAVQVAALNDVAVRDDMEKASDARDVVLICPIS
jgi:hypothetical protein